MTTTPQAPAAALPTPPEAPSQDGPKRQKFTLTRARDLDARLDAIVLRANAAVAELAAVGITEGVEEQNPIRQQLVQILPQLTAVAENAAAAKVSSERIVTLLDL